MIRKTKKKINYTLLFMALAGFIFIFIFNYLPMFGILIGFKKMDYVLNIKKALKTAEFVQWDNFLAF